MPSTSRIPVQGLLTALLLPPTLLILLGLAGALLAWRGRRWGAALAAAAAAGQFLLATPFVAGWLTISLEREAMRPSPADAPAPGAIIVLGGDRARGRDAPDVGAFTLERLRAGAALARRTGLPLLVTGGPLLPGDPPIAALMAQSLAVDFGLAARWIEPAARDTWENAAYSVALLRAEGIAAAYVVSHAWHLPRAREAFARQGFPTVPAPVGLRHPPGTAPSAWVARPDQAAESWYSLREWVGRLVYALRAAMGG